MALGRGSGCWRFAQVTDAGAIESMATRRRVAGGMMERRKAAVGGRKFGVGKKRPRLPGGSCPLERHVTRLIGRQNARHFFCCQEQGAARAAQCGSLESMGPGHDTAMRDRREPHQHCDWSSCKGEDHTVRRLCRSDGATLWVVACVEARQTKESRALESSRQWRTGRAAARKPRLMPQTSTTRSKSSSAKSAIMRPS